jgi:hypothetical protein
LTENKTTKIIKEIYAKKQEAMEIFSLHYKNEKIK